MNLLMMVVNDEPLIFPAKIPVILIQGSEGIAVGMAAKNYT